MIAWLEHGSTTKDTGARLDSAYRRRLNGFWSEAQQGRSEQRSTISGLEQGSTTKDTGAKLDSVYRSKAQRFLEQCSTGEIGAGLNECQVFFFFFDKFFVKFLGKFFFFWEQSSTNFHWSKARQWTTGARLNSGRGAVLNSEVCE